MLDIIYSLEEVGDMYIKRGFTGMGSMTSRLWKTTSLWSNKVKLF